MTRVWLSTGDEGKSTTPDQTSQITNSRKAYMVGAIMQLPLRPGTRLRGMQGQPLAWERTCQGPNRGMSKDGWVRSWRREQANGQRSLMDAMHRRSGNIRCPGSTPTIPSRLRQVNNRWDCHSHVPRYGAGSTRGWLRFSDGQRDGDIRRTGHVSQRK